MKRQFESLEQRMVTTYLGTFPFSVPSEDGYHWTELSDALVDNMVAMLGAMDRLFDGA